MLHAGIQLLPLCFGESLLKDSMSRISTNYGFAAIRGLLPADVALLEVSRSGFYVWLHREGWLYLAGVKDVFTCEIVGYTMAERMTQELCLLLTG